MARKSATRAADRAEMVSWLFEHSRDLMHVVGPDRCIRLVNPAWTELTGWREDELIGRRAIEVFHPDDRPHMLARVAQSKVGVVYESEARVLLKDGSSCWVAARRQMMPDGSHIVSMRDATEQRAHRDEIDNARRTRKALGASAGIGIWTYEPALGRIWWSDEIVAMVGFDPRENDTPEAFRAMMHPRDRARTMQAFARAVENGEPLQREHRVWARGRWMVVRVTVTTEPRPGGVFALKGISEDITELAAARDAARHGEQQARKARREAQVNARRLKMALEAAEAGVYEIDHVARTFWASPEFERITGRRGSSYEEAVHLSYPGFHPEDLPHVRASFRALHRGDKKSGESFEARIVRPDGAERWVRVYHHLKVGRNGRWLKAVGLVQDCDAHKRQELALKEAQRAAEAAGEAKGAFLANMSHEIRTPLNGVMGVLHILKSEQLTDEGRSLLDEALSCGQMLAELLNDVIDFSKIEAGRLELACEPVDPKALVEGVARLLKPQAQAKGLQLIVDADARMGWVRSDPVRLRQALFNLVGNAVKFTEKGHVVIRCRLADAGVLRFEVEDTGVGIPEAAQARLFQRFNQADASTTRKFGGSGLGLAITKRLAEMMNGQVGFTSAEGRGSTFWLEVAAEPAEAQAPACEAPHAVLEGLRVLVVEDNATNRLIATKLLENLGASVETAADGYLGVEAAARGGFDLILMDVQMPGIDGLEAARRIRALGGNVAAIPIVALTANVLSHQRQSYLEAGMDGVVGKPISPAALLSEIARLSAPVEPAVEAADDADTAAA
ncbi:sensory box histidine kinase/response regulator [Phenylobacterium zucineum HLK1]|uniref:histidine kinase n=1 Tax=Phenylobacterium zucineum (strain HLK1) TaxID=450851 RepID=B4RDA0_PHEZH|nr:PAS domain-containing hybrid sensor histidine kinase/response regulator [Phenylobacterium zucineum]ACG76704.1 sensory box histidine kinase/response regulator [Phenylobacterium zucineum HLK1]